MNESLPEANRAQLGTRVLAIDIATDGPGLTVTYQEAGQSEQPQLKKFGAVVSTVPISALNLIDLTGCDINANYAQYSAIRMLQYGPSIKIGIQFASNWWEPLGIVGGQRLV